MTNNLVVLLTVVATSTAYADTFNFATPTGSSTRAVR